MRKISKQDALKLSGIISVFVNILSDILFEEKGTINLTKEEFNEQVLPKLVEFTAAPTAHSVELIEQGIPLEQAVGESFDRYLLHKKLISLRNTLKKILPPEEDTNYNILNNDILNDIRASEN